MYAVSASARRFNRNEIARAATVGRSCKVLTKAFFIFLHFGASLMRIVGKVFVFISGLCDRCGVKFLGGLHEKSGDHFCLRDGARGLRARADAGSCECAAN